MVPIELNITIYDKYALVEGSIPIIIFPLIIKICEHYQFTQITRPESGIGFKFIK